MTLVVKQVNRSFCILVQERTNLPTPLTMCHFKTLETNKQINTLFQTCMFWCEKENVWKELLDLCGFIMLLCHWHHQFPVSLKSLHECSEFPLQHCQVCFYENQFSCAKRVFRAIFLCKHNVYKWGPGWFEHYRLRCEQGVNDKICAAANGVLMTAFRHNSIKTKQNN